MRGSIIRTLALEIGDVMREEDLEDLIESKLGAVEYSEYLSLEKEQRIAVGVRVALSDTEFGDRDNNEDDNHSGDSLYEGQSR